MDLLAAATKNFCVMSSATMPSLDVMGGGGSSRASRGCSAYWLVMLRLANSGHFIGLSAVFKSSPGGSHHRFTYPWGWRCCRLEPLSFLLIFSQSRKESSFLVLVLDECSFESEGRVLVPVNSINSVLWISGQIVRCCCNPTNHSATLPGAVSKFAIWPAMT